MWNRNPVYKETGLLLAALLCRHLRSGTAKLWFIRTFGDSFHRRRLGVDKEKLCRSPFLPMGRGTLLPDTSEVELVLL
ncbi:MAG: hypothetical protein P4L69_16875, partial [Desulfosporosinus sp.]|nr:hypothetical protein [Desulfosporosinus sp.]